MRIAVFGAGAIGCWVGARLAAGGADVTLIGRPRVLDELAGGLRAAEPGGRVWQARPTLATEAAAARDADVVLVTVKSGGTEGAARALAPVLREGAVVASLQNGVSNPDVLRAGLPGRTVLAGMVPFNVVRRAPGEYLRASSGELAIEDHPAAAALVAACRAAGLAIATRRDMRAVQWGKLVMNLNNAINALSGRPLAQELGERSYRRCLAAAQREALAVLRAAGEPVARLTPVPPGWIARVLELPDVVFRRIAGRVVAIDPAARSSMADDLDAGRPTEVEYIQGEIVRLAEAIGKAAPVNRKLAELVHAAESGGRRQLTGEELWREVSVARDR